MKQQPVSYLQTDPKWKNQPYAVGGESSTIGGSGCGPTAMAMVLATWADPAVTPLTECRWAQAHGYKSKGGGTFHSYFAAAADRYGLTSRQLNGASIYGNGASMYHDIARAAIDQGDLVIACMGPGVWTRGGHFVLVWAIQGNVIFINDPASTRLERTRGNYAVFKRQVKYYHVIKRPAKTPEKEDSMMTEAEVKKIVNQCIQEALPQIILQVIEHLPKPVVYNSIDEVPDWGKEAVQKHLPSIQGTGNGLGLSQDLLRVWVIQDREEKMREMGMD